MTQGRASGWGLYEPNKTVARETNEWGSIDQGSSPLLREVSLIVNTKLQSTNKNLFGTKVDYENKTEIESCETCKDACAGDSGLTLVFFVNRPSVARAVLQKDLSLIN